MAGRAGGVGDEPGTPRRSFDLWVVSDMEDKKMTRSNHFGVLLGASVAALLALLLTVSATQKPAQAAFPGENGKFLYCDEADRDAPCEIFSIYPDGSSRMQLTFLPIDLYTRGDTDPESSPDGSKIAF